MINVRQNSIIFIIFIVVITIPLQESFFSFMKLFVFDHAWGIRKCPITPCMTEGIGEDNPGVPNDEDGGEMAPDPDEPDSDPGPLQTPDDNDEGPRDPPVNRIPDSDDSTPPLEEIQLEKEQGTTLTIKKSFGKTGDLIPSGTFRITPYPYSFGFVDSSIIATDNDGKTDSDPREGIIQLYGVKFGYYKIQEIMPFSAEWFVLHEAQMPIHEQMPNPIINFVEKDFGTDKFPVIPDQYIVGVSENITEDVESIVEDFENQGAKILYTYGDESFKGFTLNIQDNRQLLPQILSDPRVGFVEQDRMGHIASTSSNTIKTLQSLPTGIDRIDGDLYQNEMISKQENLFVLDDNIDGKSNQDAKEERFEHGIGVDVAVLDTGISLTHPDLEVYEDVSFVKGTDSGNDDQGHGSHIAGTIAAKDNSIGVVGIVPDARLWAVKVCDKQGNCPISSQIKGVEYVTEHAEDIEVVNFSIENSYFPLLDEAINNSTSAGVTYVVAAGNSGKDVSLYSPSNNPNVITVSAFADSDGKCGGFGRPTFIGQDDTIASFSNHGSNVDIAAPGVDILSTYTDSEYGVESGTSSAAPHVTGVVALYKATYPSLTPLEINSLITTLGIKSDTLCDGEGRGYITGTDVDGFEEPLIYANSLASSNIGIP